MRKLFDININSKWNIFMAHDMVYSIRNIFYWN